MAKEPYVEKFVAPRWHPSMESALASLRAIREGHPASKGWNELESGVEKRINPKGGMEYRPWRKHQHTPIEQKRQAPPVR